MKILIFVTNKSTLPLLDGETHASGFWAEELAVPYQRFKAQGYEVDIATIDGICPTVDETSIDPGFMVYVRPEGSEDDDVMRATEYKTVIENLDSLQHPLNACTLTKEQIASYDGIYLSGGHGAISDMASSMEMAQLFHWALEMDKTIAAVCHGHCGLLKMRDSESRWPLEGYRMTCFSHSEELVTNMAERLPFVLEVELKRLGAIYEKSPLMWGSHVVVDRNLITGQNPYSSKELAETFIKHLESRQQKAQQAQKESQTVSS
jgi:putative intracellular protease/amidase